jgi:hypothetical protein
LNSLLYQVLGKEFYDRFHPRTRVKVLKATVLPRVLPSSQKEIDAYRARLEREVEALIQSRTKLRLDALQYLAITPFSACTW